MGPLMIYMAFLPLYMWKMWDVTPVTHTQMDGQWKVGQYSVWAESAKRFLRFPISHTNFISRNLNSNWWKSLSLQNLRKVTCRSPFAAKMHLRRTLKICSLNMVFEIFEPCKSSSSQIKMGKTEIERLYWEIRKIDNERLDCKPDKRVMRCII